MNIVSALVGLTIAGTAMPMIAELSLAPVIAQKRASNFGLAEQRAVTFAALHEGQDALADAPDGCELEQLEGAVSITCTEGEGKFRATVTRSFKTEVDLGYAGNQRVFQYPTPERYSGHQCPVYDAWGVYGHNDQYAEALGGACIPREAWTEGKYFESNPDAWMFDIHMHNGWDPHPDY